MLVGLPEPEPKQIPQSHTCEHLTVQGQWEPAANPGLGVSPRLRCLPLIVWSQGQLFVLGWLLRDTGQDQFLAGLTGLMAGV